MTIQRATRWVLFVAALVLCGWVGSARAQESGNGPDPAPEAKLVIDLRTTLVNGLKVTRKSERVFIEKVVKQVADGNLSRGIVTAMYRYALRKNRRFPYFYFERAMLIVAEVKKVPLT